MTVSAISLVAASLAAAASGSLLVAPGELSGLDNVQIVDARSQEAYEAGHIPGALHIDTASLSETREGVAGLLKPVGEVQQMLRGLDPDRPVVVYADMADGDPRAATRLFWILEYLGFSDVAILDGGYHAWKAAQNGEPARAPDATPDSAPIVTPQHERIARWPAVDALRMREEGVILDMRPEDYFTGAEIKEGVVTRAGHIEGAKNLPLTRFIDPETGRFLPVERIEAMLAEKGVEDDTPVITYCNTGRSASVGYFVARLAGVEDVRLYDGSMAEWSGISHLPVAGGEQTGEGS